MSSTYRILCLSHDPAISVTEPGYNRPEEAEAAIRDGIDEHRTCDLLIGRYSYPLVEVGCPPSKNRPGGHRCIHGGTAWAEVDWLRLLAAGYQTEDPAVQAVVKELRLHCWSWERLRRLRDELGITIKEPTP